jgi:hypothetical protein
MTAGPHRGPVQIAASIVSADFAALPHAVR